MSGRPWALKLLHTIDVNVTRAVEGLEDVRVTGAALIRLNTILAQLEEAQTAASQLHDRLVSQDPTAAAPAYAHRVVRSTDD